MSKFIVVAKFPRKRYRFWGGPIAIRGFVVKKGTRNGKGTEKEMKRKRNGRRKEEEGKRDIQPHHNTPH